MARECGPADLSELLEPTVHVPDRTAQVQDEAMEFAPTVIVSRRPRAGHEDAFERWNDEIRQAAGQFAGYLGSEAQRPGPAHPNEWVIVYRFDSQPHLDAWLDSPERAELMRVGHDLIDGPTREQRLASSMAPAEAVTAVLSQTIAPENVAAFRSAEAQIVAVMSTFPGFVSVAHSEPVGDVQTEYVVSFTFASRADLDRWMESDSRQEVLRLVEPFIEGERTLNVVGGFGGWFVAEDQRAPRLWKQAVAVLIALYPTTFVLSLVQRWLAPEVQWMFGLFVSNVVGIAILTWVLMPPLTRLLDPWLRR